MIMVYNITSQFNNLAVVVHQIIQSKWRVNLDNKLHSKRERTNRSNGALNSDLESEEGSDSLSSDLNEW